MESDQPGYEHIVLMDGEGIDSTFTSGTDGSEVVLLTNKRIIHLNGEGGSRMAALASLEDIEAVEITQESKGTTGLIWAALAFIIAIALYAVIDHAIGSIVAPIVVGLMGIYLIVDYTTARRRQVVTFTTGSSRIQCGLRAGHAASDVHDFVNRLFHLKERNDPRNHARRFPLL